MADTAGYLGQVGLRAGDVVSLLIAARTGVRPVQSALIDDVRIYY